MKMSDYYHGATLLELGFHIEAILMGRAQSTVALGIHDWWFGFEVMLVDELGHLRD